MYEISADIRKNRLTICLDGTISTKSVEKYIASFREAILALKPGFTALLDLRRASVFERETIKELHDPKLIAVKAGLRKSAMVLSSPALKMQMNRNYGEIGIKDEAFTDIEEAVKYLDE